MKKTKSYFELKLLMGSLCLVLLSACSTTPAPQELLQAPAPETLGQWESKVQILDRTTQKAQRVSVDFVTMGRRQLRMEVVGTFSTTVAVAVVDDGKLTYVLPRQRKYFQGAATKESLRPLLSVELDPMQVFHILFDEPLRGAAWSCIQDSAGRASSCENSDLQLKVSWLSREGVKKSVLISGPRYDVTLNLERIPSKIQDSSRVFVLNIPSGFRSI